MDGNSDIKKIRAIIEIARAEVNRQNGRMALEHLRGIKDIIDLLEHTSEWTEYSLIAGEAFLVDRSPNAESFLAEAERKLGMVPDPPDELKVRTYERLGDFYSSVHPRKPSLAKKYFALAKEVAVRRRVEEEIARISLKVVCTDLQIDRDARLQDFQTMRRVAKAESCTCATELAAWSHHTGILDESMGGMRFARGISKASDEYFRDLLRSVAVK